MGNSSAKRTVRMLLPRYPAGHSVYVIDKGDDIAVGVTTSTITELMLAKNSGVILFTPYTDQHQLESLIVLAKELTSASKLAKMGLVITDARTVERAGPALPRVETTPGPEKSLAT